MAFQKRTTGPKPTATTPTKIYDRNRKRYRWQYVNNNITFEEFTKLMDKNLKDLHNAKKDANLLDFEEKGDNIKSP